MNKVERMQAVFQGKEPDRVPVGFWFHYPAEFTTQQRVDAHIKLCREVGTDIIKVMDDNFAEMITHGIHIEKASDWRNIKLPGKNCAQYRNMMDLIRGILEETKGEAMVFPTMWSPFKIGSFTYVFGGGSDAQFMQHCKEDPHSVKAGIGAIADCLAEWAYDYLDAGCSGLYYSGQFSEPQRFTEAEWADLVKPFDLQVLNVTRQFEGKYNIVHICGEEEFGYEASPARYRDYPGDLFNWDVHRDHLSLEEGRALFGKPILGGLDNHGLLINGTPEEITEEAKKVIHNFGKKGFMLGADCTVPNTIDWSHLKAAVEASKEA